ncbi:MAG: hypothetical protein WBC44_11620 [Planctomycetaceae bacterium]
MKYVFRHAYHCGSLALVRADYRWSLCLPDGSYIRGQAASLDAAKASLDAEYNRFALACWMRGRTQPHGLMLCPMKADR